MTTSFIMGRLMAGTPPLPSQITGLLQLSRKEQDMRRLCLYSLHRLGEWKHAHKSCVDMESKVMSRLEGMVLKRQVRDAIFFYRLVKRRRIRSCNLYMRNLPSRSKVCGGLR